MHDLEHSLNDEHDHQRSAGPSLSLPAELAERYRVVRLLGAGGMGRVLLAEAVATGEQVAIKVVDAREGAGERLLREAETLRRLESPHLVRVHEVSSGRDALAIVMEHVDGPDLERLVREQGPLPWRDAVGILLGVVDALAHAHRRGVVHRDVKPANVLLGPDGRARLCDFGLARFEDVGSLAGSLTQDGAVLGTLDYMAPEQRESAREAGAAADQFSLGATLYRLVTGEPPRVIREERIPAPLRPVLLRCLEHSPSARYMSVEALGRALRDLVPDPVRLRPQDLGVGAEDSTSQRPGPDAPELAARIALALEHQASEGVSIEDALAVVGVAPDPAAWVALAKRLGLELLDTAPETIEAEASAGLPRAFAERYRVAPLRRDGQTLVLAAADPGSLGGALDVVRASTGATVATCLAPQPVVAAAIELAYGPLAADELPTFAPAPVVTVGPKVVRVGGAAPASGGPRISALDLLIWMAAALLLVITLMVVLRKLG